MSRLTNVLVMLLGVGELLYTVRHITLFKTCSTSHLTLLQAKNPGVILAVRGKDTRDYGLKLEVDSLIWHQHRRQRHDIYGQLCLGVRRPQRCVDNLIDTFLESSKPNALYFPQMFLKHNLNPTLLFHTVIAYLLCIFHRKNTIYCPGSNIIVTELSTNASAASYESDIEKIHVLSSGHQSKNHQSGLSSLLERVRLIYEARQSRRLGGFLRRRGRPVDKRKTHIPFTLDQIREEDSELEAISPLHE